MYCTFESVWIVEILRQQDCVSDHSGNESSYRVLTRKWQLSAALMQRSAMQSYAKQWAIVFYRMKHL